MTVTQWEHLDDKDSREFVDGVLEEAEMPAPLHELVKLWLGAALYAYFRKRAGFSFGQTSSPFGAIAAACRTSHASRAATASKLEGAVRTPPDVVVEVISPRPRDARRNRIDKMSDYAGNGREAILARRSQGANVRGLPARRETPLHVRRCSLLGKVRRIPTLPGLVIDLDDLWSEVNRLERVRA